MRFIILIAVVLSLTKHLNATYAKLDKISIKENVPMGYEILNLNALVDEANELNLPMTINFINKNNFLNYINYDSESNTIKTKSELKISEICDATAEEKAEIAEVSNEEFSNSKKCEITVQFIILSHNKFVELPIEILPTEDTNVFKLYFNEKNLYMNISESVNVGYKIVIDAVNLDLSEFDQNKVVYNLYEYSNELVKSSDFEVVNLFSGNKILLTLSKKLNYNTKHVYYLQLEAIYIDKDLHLNATQNITIQILPVNNPRNLPPLEFENQTYTLDLPDNLEIGTKLMQLKFKKTENFDANQKFVFHFIDTQAELPLQLSESNGIIRNMQKLQSGQFEFQVKATYAELYNLKKETNVSNYYYDYLIPATCLIKVNVVKVIHNPPGLKFKAGQSVNKFTAGGTQNVSYELLFTDQVKIGDLIGRIEVSDDKNLVEGVNLKIQNDDKKYFLFRKFKDDVFYYDLLKNSNNEEHNGSELVIIAQNKYNSTQLRLKMFFEQRSEDLLVFESDFYSKNISEDNLNFDEPILNVRAFKNVSKSYLATRYYISNEFFNSSLGNSLNFADYIYISHINGSIFLKKPLNIDQEAFKFQFKVFAYEGESERKSMANTTIEIQYSSIRQNKSEKEIPNLINYEQVINFSLLSIANSTIENQTNSCIFKYEFSKNISNSDYYFESLNELKGVDNCKASFYLEKDGCIQLRTGNDFTQGCFRFSVMPIMKAGSYEISFKICNNQIDCSKVYTQNIIVNEDIYEDALTSTNSAFINATTLNELKVLSKKTFLETAQFLTILISAIVALFIILLIVIILIYLRARRWNKKVLFKQPQMQHGILKKSKSLIMTPFEICVNEKSSTNASQLSSRSTIINLNNESSVYSDNSKKQPASPYLSENSLDIQICDSQTPPISAYEENCGYVSSIVAPPKEFGEMLDGKSLKYYTTTSFQMDQSIDPEGFYSVKNATIQNSSSDFRNSMLEDSHRERNSIIRVSRLVSADELIDANTPKYMKQQKSDTIQSNSSIYNTSTMEQNLFKSHYNTENKFSSLRDKENNQTVRELLATVV